MTATAALARNGIGGGVQVKKQIGDVLKAIFKDKPRSHPRSQEFLGDWPMFGTRAVPVRHVPFAAQKPLWDGLEDFQAMAALRLGEKPAVGKDPALANVGKQKTG